jgi:integrase
MNTQPEVKRERGRGRLYHQRGSAFWWMAFYKHGKQIRMSTEETDEKKAERALKLKLQERDAELGGGKKMITPQQQRIAVSELLDNLESDYRLRGIDSPQFRSHVKRIREHFGDMRAVEVTAALVDRYIESRLAKGARPAAINRSTQVFGQGLKLAVERGQLNSAPKLRHLSEAGNARQGFFAEWELRAVVENLPPYLRDFTLFGFLVGWRKGEIASLAWADVDGDCIRLRPENSKNGEGRMIVLEGELAELMERRKAARSVKTATGTVLAALIFHRDGSPIGDTRKSWASACKLAGVPERLFHDLRRTSVRNMIRAGVSEKVAMTVSGHKTHSMLSRYNIVSETDLRQAMRRTQDYLRDTVQESTVVAMPVRVH